VRDLSSSNCLWEKQLQRFIYLFFFFGGAVVAVAAALG